MEFTLELCDTFRPLENKPAFAEAFADAAAAVLGDEAVDRNGPISMGSEDFTEMLAAVPGAFLYLHHSGPETRHSPKFRLGPSILPLGAAIFFRLVQQRLKGTVQSHFRAPLVRPTGCPEIRQQTIEIQLHILIEIIVREQIEDMAGGQDDRRDLTAALGGLCQGQAAAFLNPIQQRMARLS